MRISDWSSDVCSSDLIHVVVNNAYLGLIRQAQRGFDMDYNVQLSFENVNAPDLGQYGVDHVTVAEGLGCKAIRVKSPNEFKEAFYRAREPMAEFQVPVVRSEERRVGKEGVSTCRYRWSHYH